MTRGSGLSLTIAMSFERLARRPPFFQLGHPRVLPFFFFQRRRQDRPMLTLKIVSGAARTRSLSPPAAGTSISVSSDEDRQMLAPQFADHRVESDATSAAATTPERRQTPHHRLRDARGTLEWCEHDEQICCDVTVIDISGVGAAVLTDRAGGGPIRLDSAGIRRCRKRPSGSASRRHLGRGVRQANRPVAFHVLAADRRSTRTPRRASALAALPGARPAPHCTGSTGRLNKPLRASCSTSAAAARPS